MKRFWKAVASVAVLAAVVGGVSNADADKADAWAPPVSSCNGAAAQAYGARVCFDHSDGYFYIYSSATTLYQSFPSNTGYSGIGGYSGSLYTLNIQPGGADEAYYDGGTGLIHLRIYNPSYGYQPPFAYISPNACYDGAGLICVYGGNFLTLAWFANTANYDFMVIS